MLVIMVMSTMIYNHLHNYAAVVHDASDCNAKDVYEPLNLLCQLVDVHE